MKRILLFLFVLVLIVGCAQQVVEPERTTETEPTEEPTEEPATEEPEPLTIDPELKSEIEEALEGGKYLYTTKYFEKLKVGEGHVFGLGIANYKYMTGARYTVEVGFVEARDSNNNVIGINKTTMASWLENYETADFTLIAGRYKVVSIPIVIKDLIKPNKETALGSYYFDARVFYYHGNFKEQEGATQRYTVRVIE